MKVRTKTILVIVSTLVIGMILGALIDRMYMHYSFKKRFSRMRSSEGIIHLFEEKIAPTDSQQVIIHEILKNHLRKVDAVDSLMRKEMKDLTDSLKLDLTPHITSEQMQRLDEILSRISRGHKRRPPFSGSRPPRPDEPPPDAPPAPEE